jgi:hypothetical protein
LEEQVRGFGFEGDVADLVDDQERDPAEFDPAASSLRSDEPFPLFECVQQILERVQGQRLQGLERVQVLRAASLP